MQNEDLRKWFKEKWVNIGKKDKSGKHPPCGTSGKKSGYAKCVPSAKAARMSKKEKASATRRKRAAQNKAGRGGKNSPGQGKKPIRVKTEGLALSPLVEKNVPTNPSLWAAKKAAAKRKFDVYPSAYANGWAARQYKKAGGGWRKSKGSKNEMEENFADGKNPERKGISKRVGIPKKPTLTQLAKLAKAKGEKGRMARWQLNMRRGKKKNEAVVTSLKSVVEAWIGPEGHETSVQTCMKCKGADYIVDPECSHCGGVGSVQGVDYQLGVDGMPLPWEYQPDHITKPESNEMMGDDTNEISMQQALKMTGHKGGLRKTTAGTQASTRGIGGGTQKQFKARNTKMARATGGSRRQVGGRKVFAGTQKQKRMAKATKKLQSRLGGGALKTLY